MAKMRLSMRKTKEILRLKWVCGLSNREIARSCQVSSSTVGEYIVRAKAHGLSWGAVDGMSEEALEIRLFAAGSSGETSEKPLPDFKRMHEELRRHKSLTLALLWQEYKEAHPEGYEISRFCELYRRWEKTLDLVMRQEHRGGEKLFVDYCDGPRLPHPVTGEPVTVQIFVAVWGASNYTYAEATWTQELWNWIHSHVRAFEYFGCVPRVVVPDNLKSGVHSPCRYEPEENPTYGELAVHYGTTVIPARPYEPRDKAKVEAGVLVVQRWILAALRHRQFATIAELNAAIRELLEILNLRPLRKLKKSRRELFQTLDQPNALVLRDRPYEFARWKKARVNVNYHIEVDRHNYSVPSGLVHQEVDVRVTRSMVEVLQKGNRVASHPRSTQAHGYTTLPEHMPSSHRHYAQWTPERMVAWAKKTGPATAALVEAVLASRRHPEQGYKATLGILRLGTKAGIGRERLEKAAERALRFRSFSFRSVKNILERGLDRQTPDALQMNLTLPLHENISGSQYYEPTQGGQDNA